MANKKRSRRPPAPSGDIQPSEEIEELYQSWLPPQKAIQLVKDSTSGGGSVERVFTEHLRGGVVRAAANRMSKHGEFGSSQERGAFEIPFEWWQGLQAEDFWTSGIAIFEVRDFEVLSLGRAQIRCFGLRFDPEGVQELIDSLPKKTPQPHQVHSSTSALLHREIASSNKGGRPRKDFWEALWAHIAAQIWLGDLKVDMQADVQRAMLNWASMHDKDLEEASAKIRARWLMEAIREIEKGKDKN